MTQARSIMDVQSSQDATPLAIAHGRDQPDSMINLF